MYSDCSGHKAQLARARGTLCILSESFANRVNNFCQHNGRIKLFFIPRSQKIFVRIINGSSEKYFGMHKQKYVGNKIHHILGFWF